MKHARPLLLLSLCALACSDDEFVPRWRVERLRVLAVVADPPDARPGDVVTLTAHTAARANAAGTPQVLWATCPRLVIDNATGARRCDGAPTVLAGDVARFTLGAAPDAGAPWSFVGIACLGGSVALDPTTMQPRCDGGEGEVFLRTVRVRTNAPNHNPRIARVALGDLTLSADTPAHITAGRAASLRVEFEADAREATTEAQPDGTTRATREELLTQFVTDTGTLEGSFRSDDDGATGAHAMQFTAPASGAARIWVVLSDGRGGFDVAARTIVVGP